MEGTAIAESAIPGVSVIIPCYNGARYLGEAIDSALAQTYSVVEVIVVDDGSTDATPEIVRSYGDRVRYLHQANGGLSAARNTGIRASSHPLVSFLDADDRFLPRMVEVLVSILQRLVPEFAIAACHTEMIDAQGGRLVRKLASAGAEAEVSAAELVLMNRFPCTVVARRDLFFQCGFFDTSLRSSEDRDMWIRTAAKYRIYLTPEVLVQIRRHEHNMSKNAVRQSDSIRKVLSKAFQADAVSRWNLPFWLKAFSIYFFQSGFMFAGNRQRLEAARRMLGSLCLYPVFWSARKVGQPPFFRGRCLARLLVDAIAEKPAVRGSPRNHTRQIATPMTSQAVGVTDHRRTL